MRGKIKNFFQVALKHPAATGLWLFFTGCLAALLFIILGDAVALVECIFNSTSASSAFQIFIFHLVQIMIFTLLGQILLRKMESHPNLCESFETVGDAFVYIFSDRKQDKLTDNIQSEEKMESTQEETVKKQKNKNKKEKNKKRNTNRRELSNECNRINSIWVWI